MTYRMSKKMVTFLNPFNLKSLDDEWPAGDYTIETEEETLDSMNFLAYRTVATTLVVRPPKGKRGVTRFIEIDHVELDEALAKDRVDTDRAQNEGMVRS